MHKVSVIDSHTGGEPTRIVITGGPDLGKGPFDQRRDKFQRECDQFRSAVVNEPRGSDVVVGALLVERFPFWSARQRQVFLWERRSACSPSVRMLSLRSWRA